jgi:hypothetical protein
MVQVAQWAGCRDNGTAACVDIEDPLMPPNPVERSVRIWDPWGELHILNPTDGRPNEKRDLSVGGPNDLQSFEAPRRDFAAPKDKVELRQRRRKGGSNKSGMPRDSPRSNMKREDAKIEITDIIDPTAEGED